MQQVPRKYLLRDEELNELRQLLNGFCRQPSRQEQKRRAAEIKQHFLTFSETNENNRQAMGTWVSSFLIMLITQLDCLQQESTQSISNILILLIDLPFDENSDVYKSTLASIGGKDIAPLSPQTFLHAMQRVELLLELESNTVTRYIRELSDIIQPGHDMNIYHALVQMQMARADGIAGEFTAEQVGWLELALQGWLCLERNYVIYFLAQWLISLHWLRPDSLRKELLLSLSEFTRPRDEQNQAIIFYELFNLPDKTTGTTEKLKYMNKLKSLPTSLFNVSQLQSMYYFSGSIKSSVESSFMESVVDFQQSNYYIHKDWNRIGRINVCLRQYLAAEDYLNVQKNIDKKTQQLIDLINMQSNAYVETLQSNYSRINELYHQVEELSLHDTLTGLHNRRYLYNNISEMLMLAVRQQYPISFVIIDIDDFKQVNDKHGHLAGDFILSELSGLLKNFFRKSDFIVRYGGEEFLIVLFNSDQVQTKTALETLRQTILNYEFHYQEVDLQISISIGIASCVFTNPYSEVNLENLISEADAAMYESKKKGKNKVTSRILTF